MDAESGDVENVFPFEYDCFGHRYLCQFFRGVAIVKLIHSALRRVMFPYVHRADGQKDQRTKLRFNKCWVPLDPKNHEK